MKTKNIFKAAFLFFFILNISIAQSQFIKQLSGTNHDLNGVYFLNDRIGFSCGENGTFVKTTTGGDYWYTLEIPTDATLNGVWFTSADTGYVIGDNNTFLKTADGGLSWESQYLEFSCDLKSIRFITPNTGIIVGHGIKGGMVLKTNDGGRNWGSKIISLEEDQTLASQSEDRNDVYLNCFSFLDENTGLIAGFSYSYIYGKHPFICKTDDGGQTFTNISPEINKDDWYIGKEVVSVNYLNSHDACAVMNTGNGANFLLISNYKVKSFEKNELSPYFNSRGRFYSAYFLDRFTGYFTGIVDGNSQIIKTIDQGNSFIKFIPPVSKSLYASCFTDQHHGYFVGQDGTILKFKDENNNALTTIDQLENQEMPYTAAATKENLKKTHVHLYNFNKKSKRNFAIELYDINGNPIDVKNARIRVFSDEVRLWVRTNELNQSIYFYTVKYNNEAIVTGRINSSSYAQLSY